MKEFNYYGQEVTVPDYAKYIATDKDGDVWWYTNKPINIGFTWGTKFGNCGKVSVVLNIKNWRGSLKGC